MWLLTCFRGPHSLHRFLCQSCSHMHLNPPQSLHLRIFRVGGSLWVCALSLWAFPQAGADKEHRPSRPAFRRETRIHFYQLTVELFYYSTEEVSSPSRKLPRDDQSRLEGTGTRVGLVKGLMLWSLLTSHWRRPDPPSPAREVFDQCSFPMGLATLKLAAPRGDSRTTLGDDGGGFFLLVGGTVGPCTGHGGRPVDTSRGPSLATPFRPTSCMPGHADRGTCDSAAIRRGATFSRAVVDNSPAESLDARGW